VVDVVGYKMGLLFFWHSSEEGRHINEGISGERRMCQGHRLAEAAA